MSDNSNSNSNFSLSQLGSKHQVGKEACLELIEEQRVSDIKLKTVYFDNCMNKFNSVYERYLKSDYEHKY